MTLVDDHQVVLIDRRRVGSVFGEQHAFDEALDGADVHLRFGFGVDVVKSLEAENVGEGLDAHHLGRSEFRSAAASKALRSTTKQMRRNRLAASRR